MAINNINFSAHTKKFRWALFFLIVGGSLILILPTIFIFQINHWQEEQVSEVAEQFPVTVDPQNKIIVESEAVNEYLASPDSPLQASVFNTRETFTDIYKWLATIIANTSIYQNLALSGGGRLVTITPGLRKEQVANSFGKALAWDSKSKKEFTVVKQGSSLPLIEGSFFPGVYFVDLGTTPEVVQDLVNKRFTEEVLSHYGESVSKVVPLNTALTIASLIERETIGTDDMRMISGIIWNRIFKGMNLQIDATLQYAKANSKTKTIWWPEVLSKDKYIKSPYNTYINSGLPPTPIANPSVASILAALNPTVTTCIFYFHDKRGGFHCSDTYLEHVKQLKKYYGRGK